MGKTVVSEKVVSTKVIKKTNPIIANVSEKFQNVGRSIRAFFTAFLLLAASIVVIYVSEKFDRTSESIESIQLEQASEVTAGEGTHKMQGLVKITEKLEAPEVGEVLYYDLVVEEYKEVEKTETEVRTTIVDGQEVEQTVEKKVLEDEWVEVSSERGKWATFSIGNYKIVPNSASKKINYKTAEYWLEYSEFDGFENYVMLENGSTRSPEIGDQRMTIKYLPVNTTLLVIGDITTGPNGKTVVKSGENFIVSNKSNEQLIADMKSAEKTMFWVYKVIAFVLMFSGLKGILAPILAILDFIPLVGKGADKVASIVAGLISLIVVTFLSLIIRFLWVFILIPVLIGAYFMYKAGQKVPEVKKD